MKVYRQKWIPWGKGFYAINLFGLVLSKEELNAVERNHEYIHTLQQREMFFILFYIWYALEWLFWFCRLHDGLKAYFQIGFEREAYQHQENLEYRKHRRHFAWLRR